MIYLDNSATTPVLPEISKVVEQYNTQLYYNPSAIYKAAVDVHSDVNLAREKLAEYLGCEPRHITYCSCGTEANNTALFSAIKHKSGRVIATKGEHLSVHNPITALAARGFDVQFARLNKDGTCDEEHLLSLITADTRFVSLIHVSNETGAVNDIAGIAKQIKRINKDAIVHSDGVQAFLKIATDVQALGVDMYTLSGHKVHAPKGIAALYSKVKLKALLDGGGQESGNRSGTENVSGIMALSKSVDMFGKNISRAQKHYKTLRDTAIQILSDGCKDIHIHAKDSGTQHILTVSMPRIKSEVMLQMLSDKKIYIGSGSACSAKIKATRVIRAVGGKHLEGTLRLSFSAATTTEEDVSTACRAILKCSEQF